jgi:ElaB/YqjD/DUF883 family membrane-anchored ribosome-binding protein
MTTLAAGRGRNSRNSSLEEALRATRTSRAAVARDFETLIGDAEDLLESTKGAVGDQASAARARLQKSLMETRDRLSDQLDTIAERGKEAAAAADEYVRAKPWQVIGIAAAAALVTGWFLSRR